MKAHFGEAYTVMLPTVEPTEETKRRLRLRTAGMLFNQEEPPHHRDDLRKTTDTREKVVQ